MKAKKNILKVTDKFFEQHRDGLLAAVREAMEGWYACDIAIGAGVSTTTVCNLRNGKVQNPNSRTLLRIMYSLGFNAVIAESRFKLRLHRVA